MSLKELRDRVEQLREQIKEQGSKLLADEAKQIFDKYPLLNSFGWVEYTDYYCDGDPCEFAVHADPDYGLELNGFNPNVDEDEDESDVWWDDNCAKEVSKLIYSVDDILESLYGDHVKVTINRDGSSTTEDFSDHN